MKSVTVWRGDRRRLFRFRLDTRNSRAVGCGTAILFGQQPLVVRLGEGAALNTSACADHLNS
jgi:hypothetical protein